MSELELKFRVPDAVVDTLRDALLRHGAEPLRLQAHYFDTADGRLAQHRIALRLRREGRAWVQTLKAPGDGAAHRLEHEVGVASVPAAAAVMPALDIRRHAGSAAGRALAAVLRADDLPLVERHGTDVLRLRCLLQDASGTQIEAALDTGSTHAGSGADTRSAALVELELEHKGGPLQGVFDLAQAWVLHGGLWLSSLSKAARGERLLRGADGDGGDGGEPQALRAAAPRLPAHADGRTLLQALLQSALEQVIANAGEVADGAVAPELIHQLRIGLRRLRTVLRELAPRLLPGGTPATPAAGDASAWEQVLADVFRQLGELRDQDAAADAVQPMLAAAGAPLLAWQAGTAPDPVAAVRHPQFQATLVAILALAHAGADAFATHSATQTRSLLAARLHSLHRRLSADSRRFRRLPLPGQHTARKRLKRLRYLADMTASLWPDKRLRRYLKRMAKAQDALGRHNDVAVAAAAFRDDAARHPEAWFAAGYLQAQLAVTAKAAEAALRKVAAVEPFWT